MWSLGCILFAMLTGTPPFECSNVQDTLMKAQKGKFDLPWQLSPQAKDLIHKLLVLDPSKRITIEDVISHEFLKMHNSDSP